MLPHFIFYTFFCENPSYFYSNKFYKALEYAVQAIDESDEIRDGDTIVGIGNTPQYIMEALKHSHKKLNLISLAISGWPGEPKTNKSDQNLKPVITPQGLKNYQDYMKKMGLSPKNHFQRVFFMDYLGAAKGPEFVIHQFINFYHNNKDKIPDIFLISLSESQKAIITRGTIKNGTFKGPTLEIDILTPPFPEHLVSVLDSVEEPEYRVMPDFQGMRWHDWNVDPNTYSQGKESHKIIQAIHDHFAKRTKSTD